MEIMNSYIYKIGKGMASIEKNHGGDKKPTDFRSKPLFFIKVLLLNPWKWTFL